ncbi:hypothetical protein KI387_027402, partial [Taxus chinensis]
KGKEYEAIISLTSPIQEDLQEDSILGVKFQSSGQIQGVKPCPIRYLASLELREKPQPVMFAYKHEEEPQSTKGHHQCLQEYNANQLEE